MWAPCWTVPGTPTSGQHQGTVGTPTSGQHQGTVGSQHSGRSLFCKFIISTTVGSPPIFNKLFHHKPCQPPNPPLQCER